MRLIDADKLRTIRSIQSGDFNSIETIQKWIDDAPTVDSVPVVRCKDCKYYNIYNHYCVNDGVSVKLDDYCSWGERRDENADDPD